jgi:hypothetical protein
MKNKTWEEFTIGTSNYRRRASQTIEGLKNVL